MRVQAFLLVLVVTTFQAMIVSVPLVLILEPGIWLLCWFALFVIFIHLVILFLTKSSKEEYEEQSSRKHVLW